MCEMSHNHHDREPKGFGFLVDMDTDDDVRRQQPTLFRRAMNSWMIVLVLLTLTAINSAPMFFGKIPFPADIVFAFPPFMAVIPEGPPAPHADIGDLVHFFYPFRTLAASNARKGELPLWNPYILSGTPFLADAQSALLPAKLLLLHFARPAGMGDELPSADAFGRPVYGPVRPKDRR